MEEKAFNQMQHLKADRHKTKCRICRKHIVWMRTLEGRAILVDAGKVILRKPGVKVLDEDGVTLVNADPKIGWVIHECLGAAKRPASGVSVPQASIGGGVDVG